MKSMFYGSAAAALAGLILGAGFKTPSDSFDVRAQDPQPYIQNADFSEEPSQPGDDAPAPYQPEYLSGVAYASAPDQPPEVYAPEPDVGPTPAVYTVEEPPPAETLAEPAPQPTPRSSAPRVLRSDALVDPPRQVVQDQGFLLVNDPVDPS